MYSLLAWSQKQPPKPADLPPFGTHDLNWFSQNPYAGDSSVHAYVIAKNVEALLTEDSEVRWQLVSDHRRIVRILDRQGTDHATVRLSFYSPKGQSEGNNIRKLKAMTLTKTATGVDRNEVKEENIFRKRVNENYEEISFSFAGVQDGSVLDLSYSLQSDYIRRLDRFYFQENIPVQSALIELANPAIFNYAASFTGRVPIYREIDQSRTGSINNNSIYSSDMAFWALEVPSIKEEPYVSSIDNFRSNISFELTQYAAPGGAVKEYTTTWVEVADLMRDNTGYKEAMKGSKFYQEWAESYAGTDDLMTKYDWAFGQVTNKVSSNGFISSNAREKPQKTVGRGDGNSAQINILLVGLCNALGMEAMPLIISEREYGSIVEELPSTQNLRHMICAVRKGNRYVYADASQLPSAPGVLPLYDLNGKGLLLDRKDGQFVDLHTAAIGMSQFIANLVMNSSLDVSGEVTILMAGNSTLDFIKVENGKYTFDTDKYEPLKDYDVKVIKVENTGRMKFRILTEVKRKEKLPSIDGIAAFSPSIDGAWQKNPFAEENRTYPVEFPYGIIQSREVNLKLPEDFHLETIPESLVVKTPDGKCMYQYTTAETEDGMTISQSLHVRQLVHGPEQYEGLRSMFEMLSKKEQEYISLAPN